MYVVPSAPWIVRASAAISGCTSSISWAVIVIPAEQVSRHRRVGAELHVRAVTADRLVSGLHPAAAQLVVAALELVERAEHLGASEPERTKLVGAPPDVDASSPPVLADELSFGDRMQEAGQVHAARR